MHPPLQWHKVPRHEWTAWTSLTNNPQGLKRVPNFGDYGVRDTGAPASFGFPYPAIRYTTEFGFMFRRHNVFFKDGGAIGVHPICASLLKQPEFRGAGFSYGDESMTNAAPQKGPTGNPTSWTQWGMSHHFATVVAGIQTPLAA